MARLGYLGDAFGRAALGASDDASDTGPITPQYVDTDVPPPPDYPAGWDTGTDTYSPPPLVQAQPVDTTTPPALPPEYTAPPLVQAQPASKSSSSGGLVAAGAAALLIWKFFL